MGVLCLYSAKLQLNIGFPQLDRGVKTKKTTASYEAVAFLGVPDGTRTHDIQNHNLTL